MPQKKINRPHAKKRSHVSNAVTVDPVNPIPLDFGTATFSVITGAPYLPFLPPKDDFAQTLLETKLLSPTHEACISTKKDYCAGSGFHDLDGQEIDQSILDWFKSMNLHNQSALKLVKNMFDNKFTFGNVPIELVKFTVAGKKKLFVYVHNFLHWRLGKPNADGIVEYAIYSPLFARKRILSAEEIKKSRQVPIYNPMRKERENWMKDDNGAERTCIWYKNDVTGVDHYGLPESIANLIFTVLEYKGGRYNLDNFDNNMVVGGVLALKGNLGQDEANRIGKEIIKTHTGDGKRGRTAVVASEEGIDSSSYHDFNTTKDGSYISADALWSQKIILAHKWDAILCGIVSPSTLGKGSGFLTKILEIKNNTVIRPEQQDIMEMVWGTIFQIAEKWMGLPFSRYNLAIKNHVDISGLTDVDITAAVQVNEVRMAKGLAEDPAMAGLYMKSTGPVVNQNQGGNDVQD
jgi:hypothetical protein